MVQKWCTSCQESTFPLSGVSQQDVCCTLSTMVDGGTTFLGSSKYISDYSLVVNPSSVETLNCFEECFKIYCFKLRKSDLHF